MTIRILPLGGLALLALAGQALAQAQTAPVVMGAHEVIFREDPDQPGQFIIATTTGQQREVEGYFPPEPLARNADGTELLLRVNTPAATCPQQFVWLTTGAPEIEVSQSFGTCAMEFELEKDPVAVVQPGVGADLTWTRYTLEDTGVQIHSLGQRPLGRNPHDLQAWVGVTPHAYLAAAENLERFRAVLSEEQMGALGAALDVASDEAGMQISGDWLIGTGRHQTAAIADRAAIGVSLSDGRVIAAIWGAPDTAPEFFGEGADLVLADPNGMPGEGFPGLAELQKPWTISLISDQAPGLAQPMTLEFGSDGRLHGRAACNSYNARYTLDETQEPAILTIGPIAATRMACPDMAVENSYLTALQVMGSLRYDDAGLLLTAPDGAALVLSPSDG